MKDILFKLYLKSLSVIKRILANIENIRRGGYRRFCDTDRLINEFNITEDMFSIEKDFDIKKLKNIRLCFK